MKELGSNHPGFISLILPELLSLDPHFEMPEPNMDDDCYVAVMLAVYNAAARESSIVTLFAAHTQRHYRFHKSRFPYLVPDVKQVRLVNFNCFFLLLFNINEQHQHKLLNQTKAEPFGSFPCRSL